MSPSYILIYMNIFTFFLPKFPYLNENVYNLWVYEINISLNQVGFSLRKANQISGSTQQIFTCSKSTIEALEKGVKCIRS